MGESRGLCCSACCEQQCSREDSKRGWPSHIDSSNDFRTKRGNLCVRFSDFPLTKIECFACRVHDAREVIAKRNYCQRKKSSTVRWLNSLVLRWSQQSR